MGSALGLNFTLPLFAVGDSSFFSLSKTIPNLIMKKRYASDEGKFSSVFTTIVAQHLSKVLPERQLEKCSTSQKSVIADQPNNASPSKRILTACVISSLGLGLLVLSGYGIWSFSHTSCDGTFNFKAYANQGLEFAYSKTNCYPPQSQQAQK